MHKTSVIDWLTCVQIFCSHLSYALQRRRPCLLR